MLGAISCVDNPDTAAIREPVPISHREYLGSLFIVNVNSRAEAKAFSDGDPFTQKGVFRSITRVRRGQWNPAAAEVGVGSRSIMRVFKYLFLKTFLGCLQGAMTRPAAHVFCGQEQSGH
jgi:uncharacterized protein YciI